MKCIVCEEPMLALEIEEVEVDHCSACGGTWLDSGELELLFDDPAAVAHLHKELASSAAAKPTKRRCPICRRRMQARQIGGADGAAIDHCKHHHGLWFDRGELARVLASFERSGHRELHELLTKMFL